MNKVFSILIIVAASIFVILFMSSISDARALSNLELYKRCYAKLTGERPSLSNSVTQQVASGQIAPTTACLNLLNKAILTGNSNTTVTNTSDKEAKLVLKTVNNFHRSWFMFKDFGLIERTRWGEKDMLDAGTPALYFTKALLDQNPSFTSAVTGSALLLPVRTDMAPTKGNATGEPKSSYWLDPNSYQFAPKGELLGLKEISQLSVPYTCKGSDYNSLGETKVHLHRSQGGGIIGNSVYQLLNVRALIGDADNGHADGGVKMPRRFGRSVYHDLLCRPLPVIRPSDGQPYIVANSPIPFRQSPSCVHCHASMDRAAAVIRGVNTARFDCYDNQSVGAGKLAGNTLYFYPVSQSPEGSWPSSPDANYARRPTNGVLFYRNYQGNLINISVTGPDDLGQKISQQDDYYICAAKRYYKYFTGLDANIGDPGDPAAPILSEQDKLVRATVVDLGLKLKQSNNLRMLVSEILNSPAFKDSGYGQ